MKKKTLQPRAIQKKDFPKLDETLYVKATLDSLVLFAFNALLERRTEFELEDLVSACFRFFPKKFALKKFFRWPDSAAVVRHWQECRRKKYVVGGEGKPFRLTGKGLRVVKQTTKTLGLVVSEPRLQVEKPIAKRGKPRIEKPVAEVKPAKPRIEKPAAEVKPAKPRIEKPAAEAKPAKPRIEKPAAEVKPAKPRVEKPAAEAKPAKPQIEKPAAEVKPAKPRIEKPAAEVKPVKQAKPQIEKNAAGQIPLPLPKPAPKPKAEPAETIWKEKLHPPEPTVVVAHPQPEKETPPAPSVSPEARIRAGKFVRMMETSDAYVQYKKLGEKSNISEFDFRSLLLCTMESSPETLARNVEQFKGYAAIHNRADLIAFLDFCANRFAPLLIPQKAGRGRR